MDTQDSSVIDVPHMKLAKVGKDRDRKRGGAGWLGARGAGSGFGALGGAGAGAGGFMGTGMSLAKLLMVLLATAGVSVGAWQAGNMLAASSASGGKAPAPKIFADKDSQKYADTSGVIKQQNTIPNSLGYVNNDGLTDEQRAAQKAAADAAAAKAAADAQAKADADAKAKAVADAAAAKAAADAQAKADADAKSGAPKIGLGGTKFGSMSSGFGGGSGLSGGAGMSGGIGRSFGGAEGMMGPKGQKGNLSALSGAAKVATSRAAMAPPSKGTAQGFAARQAQMARGAGVSSLGAGQSETTSAGAGSPWDNSATPGTAIAGPGITNGTQSGPADGGTPTNPGGGSGGGPISSTPSCGSGQEATSSGGCQNIGSPSGQGAAPYQGLINAVLMLLALVLVLNAIALMLPKDFTGATARMIFGIVICALGASIMMMGGVIAMMKGGDMMIGGVIALVGAFIGVQGGMLAAGTNQLGGKTPMSVANMAAPTLIATAVGGMAAASKSGSSMMM